MSSDSSKDPIADALNSLHDNEPAEERKADEPLDQNIDAAATDEDEIDLGNFADDLDGSTQDLSEFTVEPEHQTISPAYGSPRNRPAPRARIRRPTQWQYMGVKALLVIGMLLLIPAIWAVAVLAGLSVPMSHRQSAHAMALFMLISWPVAGSLIAGAVYFSKHFAKLEAICDAAEGPEDAKL